jgi:hypothetical protein
MKHNFSLRMPSSGMWHRVAVVRTDVSEERIASIIKALQLLDTANDVPSSLIDFTLMMEVISSTETFVLTKATRRYIPKYGILHSHRRENLKCYMSLTVWAL